MRSAAALYDKNKARTCKKLARAFHRADYRVVTTSMTGGSFCDNKGNRTGIRTISCRTVRNFRSTYSYPLNNEI